MMNRISMGGGGGLADFAHRQLLHDALALDTKLVYLFIYIYIYSFL